MKFEDFGNPTKAEIDRLFKILTTYKKAGQFRAFWSAFTDSVNFMVSKEVVIESMWSPAVALVKSAGVNILYAAPPEGFRGWCSAEGISSKVTDPAKLQACYDYINWNYNGYLGAVIMRQGYYIANGQKLLPWINSAAGKKAGFSAAEYDYWWNGKPAARDLPGITGKVGDIKKGERREGGSFPKRICKYASWNSYPREQRLPHQEGERLPVRLAPHAGFGNIAVRGGGTRRPLTIADGSGLDLVGLTKVFAGGTVAVDDVNLHVDHGEYVVLLGPSGCGKTTTLRMIGGHEFPTSGDIVLDGQSLVDLPPHKRPTTTVFQHFALFPHRSVLSNVEFGLKMHGVGKDERRKLAFEALDMVGLTPLADRKPRALSGGQQQRVALARVLVTKPKALLLDEPLGDLDRLLQLRMRVELRNLQRQLGLMFIHVTHNQEEALSMADRIVVMNEARIQQVADPLTIATKPATDLVARFMGDNNIIRGTVTEREGDRLVVEDEQHVRASVRAPGAAQAVGDPAMIADPRRGGDGRRERLRSRRPQFGRVRDRLRRVPRRPRQAPPAHGRRAHARQGRRPAVPRAARP